MSPYDHERIRVRSRTVDLRPSFALLMFVLFLAALLGLPRDALGMTVQLSAEEMSARSSSVVLADVVKVTARPDADNGVVTEVVLHVERTLHGSSQTLVTLELPGGSAGGLTVYATEVPHFARGDRVVVFLDAQGRVIGGRQGRLGVSDDRIVETGESLARLEGRVRSHDVSLAVKRAFPEVFGLVAETDTSPVSVIAGVPMVSAVSPSGVPAGTGETIKIVGSGFGSTEGTVEFYYRSGTPIVASAAQVKSWTDTMIETEVPVGTVDGYSASAGSGPITVVTATGGRSEGYSISVPYGLGGSSWTTEPTYYVDANTPDTDQELALVRAGADAWSGVADFSLHYGGTTTSPSLTNSTNEVWWASLQTGILGRATYWFDSSNHMVRADIEFNDADPYVTWGDGSTVASWDVQSVATHEFGHWLALRDLYGPGDTSKVMYGSLANGTRRRTLTDGDRAGIAWIYGGGVDITPPASTLSGLPASWVSDDVALALSATDSDSGVASILYRIGSGAVQTYHSPFSVTAEGATNVSYWAVDLSGNTESPHTATVRIDRTAPVTAVSSAGPYYGPTTVRLSATDSGSGVASTRWSVDGGPLGSGLDVALSVGDHSLAFSSQDRLGNAEATVTANIEVLPVPEIALKRVAGTNRFLTSVEISRANFAAGAAPVAVLATGAQFADALSASGLAGTYDAPLLLNGPDTLDSAVADELKRLGTRTVIVVGGTGAISTSVAQALVHAGYTVDRLAGANRYDTAGMVARRIAAHEGSAFTHEAFIARGDDFADALAAAPYAYARRMPVLLVEPTSLPGATRDALTATGITHAIVAGGTGAVGENVAIGLGVGYERIAGSTRYATAAALVRTAIGRAWAEPRVIGVTTGQDFPDALGGGAAIGANGGVVLLTPTSKLDSSAQQLLRDSTSQIETIQVFGGMGAVDEGVLDSIRSLWNLR